MGTTVISEQDIPIICSFFEQSRSWNNSGIFSPISSDVRTVDISRCQWMWAVPPPTYHNFNTNGKLYSSSVCPEHRLT